MTVKTRNRAYNARFTDSEVQQIREAYHAGHATLTELGRRWGATPTGIRLICTGRAYKNAPGPVGSSEAARVTRHRKKPRANAVYVRHLPDLIDTLVTDDLSPEQVSRLTVGMRGKFQWRCPEGHIYPMTIGNRYYNRQGCSICSGQQVTPETCLRVTNPALGMRWHTDLNAPLTPDDIGAGATLKVWWQGECGHVYDAWVYAQNRGQRCGYCSGARTSPERAITATHPEIAGSWHPSKNGDARPYMVSAGSNRRVWWICPEGHEWPAQVAARALSGTGCPHCVRLKRRSVREIRLAYEMAYIFGSSADTQVIVTSNGDWSADFAAPKYMLVVEYDGAWYHSRSGYAERDLRKTQDLIGEGWTVIRVREDPLPMLNDWDVPSPHSGNIKPTVDAILDSLLSLRPELTSLARVQDYRMAAGTRAHGHADKAVARLRKAQRKE